MNDHGERYKVTYRDGLGTKCTFGFTDAAAEAAEYVKKIKANGAWRAPTIIDRKKNEKT